MAPASCGNYTSISSFSKWNTCSQKIELLERGYNVGLHSQKRNGHSQQRAWTSQNTAKSGFMFQRQMIPRSKIECKSRRERWDGQVNFCGNTDHVEAKEVTVGMFKEGDNHMPVL